LLNTLFESRKCKRMQAVLPGHLPPWFPCQHCRYRRKIAMKTIPCLRRFERGGIKCWSSNDLLKFKRHILSLILVIRRMFIIFVSRFKGTGEWVRKNGRSALIKQRKRCRERKFLLGQIHQQPSLCGSISRDLPDGSLDFHC